MRCFRILLTAILCFASMGCNGGRTSRIFRPGHLHSKSPILFAQSDDRSREIQADLESRLKTKASTEAGYSLPGTVRSGSTVSTDVSISTSDSTSNIVTSSSTGKLNDCQRVSLASFDEQSSDREDEKQKNSDLRQSSRRKSDASSPEKDENLDKNQKEDSVQKEDVSSNKKDTGQHVTEAHPPIPDATGILRDIATHSELNSSNAYSLQDIEQSAIAHNPSLAAAQAAICKSRGIQHQIGILPNPTVGYFGQQLADAGTDQHGIFLEREFVRGDKLRLNREALAQTTLAQQRELETQQHRVLTDVRVLFYEAIAAQQQVEAARQLQATAKRGVEIARDRLKAEEGTRIEVLQSETLLSEITLTVERTEIAYRAAWKELAAISGLPPSVPIQLVGELAMNRSDLEWDVVYEQINLQSPELATARAVVCEKSAMVRRQQVQAIPNLTGQLGAGYDNGTNSGMINVQVSAPIPTVNKNHGNISAANADYQLAVENVRRIEQSIKSRLARVAQEYESALASVKKHENEIIPQSASGLELSETAYQAGELDFLQVLILRRSYFESSIRLIESKSQLAQAQAKIEGLLLTGGLTAPQDFTDGDGIRSASFGGQ